MGIGLSLSKKTWDIRRIVLAISINLEGMGIASLLGVQEACFHGLSFAAIPWAMHDLHPWLGLALFLQHLSGRVVRAIVDHNAG
jgi:hypothetical protein